MAESEINYSLSVNIADDKKESKNTEACYNNQMDFLKRYLKNKYVIGGGIVIVIVAVLIVKSRSNSSKIESVEVKIGNVIEKVSVTGKVSSVEKADLAFAKSGTLASIYVKIRHY